VAIPFLIGDLMEKEEALDLLNEVRTPSRVRE